MLLQLWYLLTNPNPPRTFGFPPNPTICTQACSLVLPSFLDLCVDSTTLMQSREARDEACWGQFPANAGGVDCSMQVLVERSDRVSSVRSLRWTPSFVCKSGPCVLVGWATPLWGHFRRESCNFWRRLILPRLRSTRNIGFAAKNVGTPTKQRPPAGRCLSVSTLFRLSF